MQFPEKQMSQAKLPAALFAFSASNGGAFLPSVSHNWPLMDKDRVLLLFFRLYLQ
jgi:hypothetical protein